MDNGWQVTAPFAHRDAVMIPDVCGSGWWGALEGVVNAIPCADCSEHGLEMLSAMHDLVNQHLGKPLFDKANFEKVAGYYAAALGGRMGQDSNGWQVNAELRQRVADIIIRQLGGSQFKATVGPKQIVALPDGVQFGIPRTKTTKINKVVIKLTDQDLYDLEFWDVAVGKNVRVNLIERVENVFAENLREVFTAHTGLDTTLGKPSSERMKLDGDLITIIENDAMAEDIKDALVAEGVA